MIRIHRKDHKFGHFDLSNLYFVENRGDSNQQVNNYMASMAHQRKSAKKQAKNDRESTYSSQVKSRHGSVTNKSQKINKFSLEFLFIEKNLQNLAILQNNQVINQGYLNGFISQVTEIDQERFTDHHLDSDFFCLKETERGSMSNTMRDISKSKDRSKSGRDRSKSRDNRWSNRSKSGGARSISQPVMEHFKNEIRTMQNKIDQMKHNFDKNVNKVDIDSLQIFV